MGNSYIYETVQLREKIQKHRIAFGNRLAAIENGSDDAGTK